MEQVTLVSERMKRVTAAVSARITALCTLVLATGCGEASVRFRGHVSASDGSASHSFDQELVSGGEEPIAGAQVRLYVDFDDIHCTDVRGAVEEEAVVTNALGEYETVVIFGGIIGTRARILVCVHHTAYESYEYKTIFQDTTDPMHGQKSLNFHLRPNGQALARP